MKASLIAALPLLAIAAGCGASRPPPASSILSQLNVESARPFQTNVLDQARANEAYRHVLFTGARTQLALMTIPPAVERPEDARGWFRTLRKLAERHGLSELSMGMSADFDVAIEEGATMVRVGTAVFGPRVPRVPGLPGYPDLR